MPESPASAWSVMGELTALAGGNPRPLFQRARARARRILLDEFKVNTLARIAHAMARTGGDPDPWPVFREAMEITDKFLHEFDRPRAWVSMVRHMATAGDNPDENLRRILEAAEHYPSLKPSAWSESLAPAVELIAGAGGTAQALLPVALTLAPPGRGPLLAELTGILARRQDTVGFKQALEAGACCRKSAWLVCAELTRLFPAASPGIAALVRRDSRQPATR